ncbi:discoidin domain-containing protein [Cohnella candidum]|uniref:Coagulation factor 5/8 type domain-containing protein n=1 Tax=Cohnella candidum TaxID=2674991 RepID=A0A3G3JSD8_9BACL|nr:discoidin domain-containing protein [Cohnella candidum]AYQ71140.1 coagulation factor 5/8 type domain-containing protein [Cohnella candidum]
MSRNKGRFFKPFMLMLAILTGVAVMPGNSNGKTVATVQVENKNGIVTAGNGTYALSYDLSSGRGSIAWNGVTVMENFHSAYKLAGQEATVRSTDPATRTAEWTKPETSIYGRDEVKLTIKTVADTGAVMALNVYLLPDKAYFLADMSVTDPTAAPIEMLEPFEAASLDLPGGSDKRVFTTPYSNNFDFGVAPVHDFGNSQNGADRFEGEQLTWQKFNGISHWVTALFDETSKRGIVAGAATAKKWKSAQRLGEAQSENGPLSAFALYNWGGSQSGAVVESDKFFVGFYDDYQSGLEEYGKVYDTGEPHLKWNGSVPMGYNTYYSHYNYATAEAMYPMVDYMAKYLKPLGYEYFNLDGGFQPEKGLPSEEGMKAFADYVHSKGLKVGGYQTPFTIYDAWLDLPIPGTPYTHRDICLKDANGNLIRTYLGTYAMDVTHPGAQVALRNAIQQYVDWGFDYLKLDFIDMGMYEGQHYDPSVNGMQAYRIGMGIIRDTVLAAGRPIYLNESIAPLLPAAFAHGRRSACDTSIGVDGYSGIERQAFNTAASWWTNGTLYEFNDPDMIMPENFTQGFWYKYTQNEGKQLATTVAMGGGHWLIGDNLPFLSEERMDVLENKDLLAIVKMGKAAKPVQMPNVYHKGERPPSVLYLQGGKGDVYVGLTNWSTSEDTRLTVKMADLGLNPHAQYTLTEVYSGRTLGKFLGEFVYPLPPKGTAIVKISNGGSGKGDNEPVNLALGKPVNVSSSWSADYDGNKMTDGLLNTRWSAADGHTSGEWAEIDFGQPERLNRVVIKEHKGSYLQIANYALQYWDGSRYVDLTKGFTVGDNKIINFKTVTTSKIRLFMTSNYIIPSIEEIEAYNVEGNGGPVIVQDSSNSGYSWYSDIRAKVQRMQVFTLKNADLPKLDVYIYESYRNTVPADAYYFDIVTLDEQDNPKEKIFSASLPAYNIPGSDSAYSIYPRLTNLDTSKKYGLILKSPSSVMTPTTDNNYGFAYSDGDPYPDGYEKLSLDGGVTWLTENGGRRDLIFTLYSNE